MSNNSRPIVRKLCFIYSLYPASIGLLVPIYYVLAKQGYSLELIGLSMLIYRLAYYGGGVVISAIADLVSRRVALLTSMSLVLLGILTMDMALFYLQDMLSDIGLLLIAFLLIGVGQKTFERIFRVYITDLHELSIIKTKISDVFSSIGLISSFSSILAILAGSYITYYITFHFSIVFAAILIIFIIMNILMFKFINYRNVRRVSSTKSGKTYLKEVKLFFARNLFLSISIALFLISFSVAYLLAEMGFQLVYAKINLPGFLFGVGLLVISFARGIGNIIAKALLRLLEERKTFIYLTLAGVCLSIFSTLLPSVFTMLAILWCIVAYAVRPVMRSLILKSLPSNARATISTIYGMLSITGTILASLFIASNFIVNGLALINIILFISAVGIVKSSLKKAE